MKTTTRILGFLSLVFSLSACLPKTEEPSRLVLFVGVDISGSFVKGPHFDDSLRFLSYYLHTHLSGLGGLEVPREVFVSSIGGATSGEPKTFFPIHAFRHKTPEEIELKLREIFPKKKLNPYTDFNAFFSHVVQTIKNNKLLLRPISVLLVTDGRPDSPDLPRAQPFKGLRIQELESVSRNVTLRILYTSAVTGSQWQSQIKRKRIRIWTQDAEVMNDWKDPKIFQPATPIEKQILFFNWMKDNVDFHVRAKRVD